MSAPFSFSLRYSRLLLWVTWLAHLLPLLCIGATGVPGWVRWLVAGGVLVSMCWQWRSVQKLRYWRMDWAESGEVWLRSPEGDVQIEVLADSIDLGWLIVVHWCEMDAQRQGHAALTRDAFAPESWRVLRRRLRWNRPGTD